MKESRRHRWIKCDVDQSVCRDCGLEIRSDRIKSGNHGPCAGKSCEHQNLLTLIDRIPQELGNRYPGDYFVACVGCGTMVGIEMLAHHNPMTNKVTGWLFTCENCRPTLADSQVIFVPKEVTVEQEG